MKKKILVVEDERTIADILVFNLEREGYEAASAGDGPAGLKMALEGAPQVPVIMLTAREEESDKVDALEMGADDYITKPFSMRELMARVKANMRRTVSAEAEAPAAAKEGKLVISPEQSAVYKNGKPLDLSVREYDILNYLSKTPGRVVTREELMEKVWGYEYYGDLRAVDVAIRRLREKVEDEPAQPKYIITKRGMGYYYPEQP